MRGSDSEGEFVKRIFSGRARRSELWKRLALTIVFVCAAEFLFVLVCSSKILSIDDRCLYFILTVGIFPATDVYVLLRSGLAVWNIPSF